MAEKADTEQAVAYLQARRDAIERELAAVAVALDGLSGEVEPTEEERAEAESQFLREGRREIDELIGEPIDSDNRRVDTTP